MPYRASAAAALEPKEKTNETAQTIRVLGGFFLKEIVNSFAFEVQTKHLEAALDYQEATEELRGLSALMCAR